MFVGILGTGEPPTKEDVKVYVKPPKGLKPKYVHDAQRVREIQGAVKRYMDVDMPIPIEWIQEYNELIARRVTIERTNRK